MENLVKVDKSNVLGGKISNNGKNVIVASVEDGLKVIEIIERTLPQIGDIIERGADIFNELKQFFDDLFNKMPHVIIVDGVRYRYTEQKAGGKALDIVRYQGELDANLVLIEIKEPRMIKARNEMYEQLIIQGLIA